MMNSLCPRPIRTLLSGSIFAIVGGLWVESASFAFEQEAFDQLVRTGDCPRCDLSGADLRWLNLSGANLEQANLAGANFYRSNLDNADLSGADLTRAYLAEVSALASNFNSAQLDEATLYQSDFTGATLYATRFGNAYIEKSQFVNALLVAADMSDVVSVSNNFEGAILCGAEMRYGDYRYGCLDEATETEASKSQRYWAIDVWGLGQELTTA